MCNYRTFHAIFYMRQISLFHPKITTTNLIVLEPPSRARVREAAFRASRGAGPALLAVPLYPWVTASGTGGPEEVTVPAGAAENMNAARLRSTKGYKRA